MVRPSLLLLNHSSGDNTLNYQQVLLGQYQSVCVSVCVCVGGGCVFNVIMFGYWVYVCVCVCVVCGV